MPTARERQEHTTIEFVQGMGQIWLENDELKFCLAAWALCLLLPTIICVCGAFATFVMIVASDTSRDRWWSENPYLLVWAAVPVGLSLFLIIRGLLERLWICFTYPCQLCYARCYRPAPVQPAQDAQQV